MMERRRALMGEKKEDTGVALGTLTAGTGIWIEESGTAKKWIYLGKDDSGNCQLLRDKTYGAKRIVAATTATPNYDGSEMDAYLSGTYLSKFTAKVQRFLVATTISYQVYDSNAQSSAYPNMSKKCYLPTMKQMGLGGSESGVSFLPALKTFYNTTNEKTARKGYNESNTNVQWWMSSAYTQSNRFRCTLLDGGLTYNQGTNSSSIYYRPMLSFSAQTPVQDTSDGYAIR